MATDREWGELEGLLGTRGLPNDFGRLDEAWPPRQRATHLTLDLLENGIDFIRSGVEDYFVRDDADARSHKYALLHIFAGVQLILKERLRREHASLIFVKVEDAGNDDRPTVGLDATISRLQSCAGLALDAKDVKLLTDVRRVRNRLEHYSVKISLTQTQYWVGRLCEFVYFFLRDQLDTELWRLLPDGVSRRLEQLQGIAARLDSERVEEWRERARPYRRMSVAQQKELLRRTESHPKDNPNAEELHHCPECGETAVVGVADDMAVCTNRKCRQVLEAGRCRRCEALVVGSSDASLCETCQGWFDAQ